MSAADIAENYRARVNEPCRLGGKEASAAPSAQREDGHMQHNYGDETKRAAAAETGGADVLAAAKADTPISMTTSHSRF